MFILYYVDNLTCVCCCYDCYLLKRYETGGSVITDVDCFSSHQILLEKCFSDYVFDSSIINSPETDLQNRESLTQSAADFIQVKLI